MNPKVALVLLILVVVLACVALGLTFSKDGPEAFGPSSSQPEDSDWSKKLSGLLLPEVVYDANKVVKGTGAGAPTQEPDGCIKKGAGSGFLVEASPATPCALVFPVLRSEGKLPERGANRIVELPLGSCQPAVDWTARWTPRVGPAVRRGAADWSDRISVPREGGTLTFSPPGSGREVHRCTLSSPPGSR